LAIENGDNQAWTCVWDSNTRILWVAPAEAKASSTIPAHGGVSIKVGGGEGEVRYAGEKSGTAFTVHPNEKTLLLFTRVNIKEYEGIYVSIFEKGERRGGARLALLRGPSSAAPPVPEVISARPAVIVERPPVIERTVVVSEPVYYAPSPVVVYTHGYYYPPPIMHRYPVWRRPHYHYRAPACSVGYRYVGRHGSVGFGISF
jgi:hypothetical protein